MIDAFDAYLREPRVEQIFDATAWDARTPRSVEAHGQQERDEDGHPPGTRVVIQFGSNVGVTSSSSDTSIHTVTFYAAVPVTEVGPYVSNKIVEDMKATLHFDQTWVPPTVRGGRR